MTRGGNMGIDFQASVGFGIVVDGDWDEASYMLQKKEEVASLNIGCLSVGSLYTGETKTIIGPKECMFTLRRLKPTKISPAPDVSKEDSDARIRKFMKLVRELDPQACEEFGCEADQHVEVESTWYGGILMF
jgi:hypothetical protein